MPQPDFTIRLVRDSEELRRLSGILEALPCFALDIETINWWNRWRERVALVQIAFRQVGRIRVAVIDALADLDLQLLRSGFEQPSALKIIHNAAFDAVRLNEHYGFNVSPVFDTMIAARRSGERKYSLKAQVEIHLGGLRLDKSARTSDWSRRPLGAKQLDYAALDAVATLLLYENQTARNLGGDYRLKPPTVSAQKALPLEVTATSPVEQPVADSFSSSLLIDTSTSASGESSAQIQLTDEAATMPSIVAELPTRYNPDGLAASVGEERAGLAGWIIDRRLGENAEPDEETVRLAIADLCQRQLIRITKTRRLAATEEGARLWHTLK